MAIKVGRLSAGRMLASLPREARGDQSFERSTYSSTRRDRFSWVNAGPLSWTSLLLDLPSVPAQSSA